MLESLLLAVSGGALGVLIAWWGAGALAGIIGRAPRRISV